MTTPTAIGTTAQAPRSYERVLHVWTLCAFAFSEPLFAALTQQFIYLHDLKAGWREIGYVLLLLMVAVPGLWALLDQLAVRCASRWGGWGQNIVFILLLCLVWLSLLRPFLRLRSLELMDAVWAVSLLIAFAAAGLSMWLYQRSQWMRHWCSVAALGIVCFPGMFVYQFATLRKATEHPPSVTISNPVPVVMIVFDEFSGTTLMTRDLQVDSDRFPNFSRLAQTSTWYRQASTVHTRTGVAVPALLSGRYPEAGRPALEGEYPGNLFRVIDGTQAFDMTVYEPITRLCPPHLLRHEVAQRPWLEKLKLLTETLAAVYPRLILPRDTPLDFPPISKVWFGLPEKMDERPSVVRGLYRPYPFNYRAEQLQTFVASLEQSEQKTPFYFIHVEFPHLPWCYLPSGTVYNCNDWNPFHSSGAGGELGEDWSTDAAIVARNEHRYLQQARFADQFVGSVLDKLQEIELLDECLLIVTADHGVSFRPGHSRRVPDATTMPDLLSVPLFIKLPEQTSAQVSDQNVESVDLLPTIAEVQGIELPELVDGWPVSQPARRPRKTLYFESTMTTLEPRIPQMQAAVDRRWEIFGSGSPDDPPPIAVTHPEWRGRSVSDFTVEDRLLDGVHIDHVSKSTDAGARYVPCLVSGSVDVNVLPEPPDLVIAVNGVIRDSSPTFSKERGVRGFEFLLRDSAFDPGNSQLELFHAVAPRDGKPRLQRIAQWTVQTP